MFEFFEHLGRFFLGVWNESSAVISLSAIALLEVAALAATIHILLIKRDSRSALGWIVAVMTMPGIGILAYILFGVNRIRTRAREWRGEAESRQRLPMILSWDELKNRLAQKKFPEDVFGSLYSISNHEVRPLVFGCSLKILHNGEKAYPEMLKAIQNAQKTVFLSSYIFENNVTGNKFVEALAGAKNRGVEIKVILDGIGTFYSIPSIMGKFHEHKIPVQKFLPPSLSKRSIHLNLRNHRKILTVDGQIGFTGGMNIGDRHLAFNEKNPHRVVDIHFCVKGPVVGQLEEAFLEDWNFLTGQENQNAHSNEIQPAGEAWCRGISAGPNEDFEKLRWIVNGAFSSARKSVCIMTPYFIPDNDMMAAIITARLKGVDIEIILPEKTNLPFVKWASQAYMDELLRYGVKIYYRPAPFAHSKFFIVDNFYSLIGSANLDPRSLRLNFEFNLEVFDREFARELWEHFVEIKNTSRLITRDYLRNRFVLLRLRDAIAKLFGPYF